MGINAASVWRVRPSGNNANGGGYDATISGAITDYSKQDAPLVTFNGATVTASTAGAAALITITGYTVDGSEIGNALAISAGTNFTVGIYFVVGAATGLNQLTLDRNVATGVGLGMVGRLGGGWATPEANTAANIVPGNIVYVLGGASPSYGAPDYVGVAFVPVSGSTGVGLVRFVGDPNTPANNGFGGLPLISVPGRWANGFNLMVFQNLFLVGAGTTNNAKGVIDQSGGDVSWMVNVIFDQNGYDLSLSNGADAGGSGSGAMKAIGCEVFSSVAARGTTAQPGLSAAHYGIEAVFCNIHDCLGVGAALSDAYNHYLYCIMAKNGSTGVTISSTNQQSDAHQSGMEFCTVDGNLGSGISHLQSISVLMHSTFNCIISNHATGGTFGMTIAAGTAASNEFLRGFIDYNVFYGNSSNYNAINAGAHDTSGGSNPYVGQSTENYTLA